MSSSGPFRTVTSYDDSAAEPAPDAAGGDGNALPLASEVPSDDTHWQAPDHDDTPSVRAARRRVAVVGALGILLWTALFAYLQREVLAGGITAPQVTALLRDWAVPPMLVLVCWLLLMRTSTREASRFRNISLSLDTQAVLLEQRLASINRELSLARDFLSHETRELDFIGRSAVERVTSHAGALQEAVAFNAAHVDTIATVGAAALENMNRLRQDLPVIAAAARDMSNQIGNVGRSASEQIDHLGRELETLQEAGSAAAARFDEVQSHAARLFSDAREQVGELASLAEQRLRTIEAEASALHRSMAAHEDEAIAALTLRTGRLTDELVRHHERLIEDENAHSARLAERMDATREQIGALNRALSEEAERAEQHAQQRLDQLRDSTTGLLAELAELERQAGAESAQRMSRLRQAVADCDSALKLREQRVQEQAESFAARLAEQQGLWSDALREQAATLDHDLGARQARWEQGLAGLTREAERVLHAAERTEQTLHHVTQEAGAARHSMDLSVQELIERLGALRELVEEADAALSVTARTGQETLDLARSTATVLGEQVGSLAPQSLEVATSLRQVADDVARRLDTSADVAGRLQEQLAAVHSVSGATGTGLKAASGELAALLEQHAQAREHLDHHLHQLRATLNDSAQLRLAEVDAEAEQLVRRFDERLKQELDARSGGIAAAFADLARRAQEDLSGTLADAGEDAARHIETTLAQAAARSHDALSALRDQLARLNELTANLEARVSRAREQAEEEQDSGFARRVSALTEQLQSASIDVEKFLATEVSDLEWQAYLKGDRGIFSRKAVRLLAQKEAREIADLYHQDADFRETVNRYIHDFESMLRLLLSTREGHNVGVTMLSSDIGKLYVALAQAIERLRR
ncbi:hypothetical protein EYB45_07330 [Erythrobacteraceae bacterium CFH 75059]|uniref:hypothetical protein n=1 Tax=Qipengyuania thermophila TaxID=2509361 RepID=UPI0010222E99|nr:hypothetical protein [Qipengyuania thermophila]TCD05285.1 hypothetical protein EYB45_07330 [Erythrobacteraceae bacterium CFH 75059]